MAVVAPDAQYATNQLASWSPNVQMPDIVGTLAKAQALKGQRIDNQNALASQRANQLFAQSIGPNGQPDMQAYGASLHSDPLAALAAQKAFAEAQNSHLTALQNHNLTLDNGIKQLEVTARILSPLAAAGKNATPQMLAQAGAAAVAAGFKPAEVVQMMTTAPNDPSQLSDWAQQHIDMAQPSINFLKKIQVMSNGAQQFTAGGNPNLPDYGQPQGTVIPDRMGPAQAATLQNITTPSGQSVAIPTGQIAAQNGIPTGATANPANVSNALVQPPAQGGNALVAPGAASLPQVNVGSGYYKPAVPTPVASAPLAPPPAGAATLTLPSGKTVALPPNGEAAPAAPSAPAQQEGWGGIPFPQAAKPFNYRGGAVAGPSPGAAQAAAAEQATGATQLTSLQNEISNAGQQRNLLQGIVAEGANAGTGPGAEAAANFGGLATEFGLPWGGQATSEQLTSKNVMQLIQAQASKLGVPTDEKMATVLAGTPNTRMTPDALKGAAGIMLGQIDYKQAELQAWNTYSQAAGKAGIAVGPGDFAQFNEAYQKNADPAVFQWKYITPAQRAAYLKSLGKDGQAQFVKAANWAVTNGLVNANAFAGQ